MLRPRPERVLLSGPRLVAALLGLAVDQLVAWGALYYAYAILARPIAADLGLSPLVVAAAFSAGLIVSGETARRVGPVLDARGPRGVLRAGAVLAPIALAAIAVARGAPGLVLALALVGVAQAFALYDPAFRAVLDWCPDERPRARALLLVTSLGGLASTVFLPLTSWLVERLGWRDATLALAAVVALVLVPGRFALPLPARGRARAAVHPLVPPRSARVLALGLAVHALVATGVVLALPWRLVESGASGSAAAALAGVAGAAQLPGRWLAAPLRRLVGPARFLPGLLALQAVALLGVAAAGAAPACVIALGAASGMMTLERTSLLVDWYGRDRFGAHQGHLAAATSVPRALSPFVVEAGHQLASYASVFAVLAIALAASAWVCARAARAQRREASSGSGASAAPHAA